MTLTPHGAATPDVVDVPVGNGPVSDGVTLWLPLGAGGHCVRRNGRLFELVVARHERRQVCDLYHCALEVRLGTQRFVGQVGDASGAGIQVLPQCLVVVVQRRDDRGGSVDLAAQRGALFGLLPQLPAKVEVRDAAGLALGAPVVFGDVPIPLGGDAGRAVHGCPADAGLLVEVLHAESAAVDDLEQAVLPGSPDG